MWIDIHTPDKAMPCEYFCTALLRAFFNRQRAQKLADQMRSMNGGHLHNIIAHSNGADVVCDSLRWHSLPAINHIHLICGACEADFNKNGLNRQLSSGNVGRVVVYVAGRDRALALAHSWLGHVLGYGTLGLKGPTNILPSVADKVSVRSLEPWCIYGHSDCWSDDNFLRTMQELTNQTEDPS